MLPRREAIFNRYARAPSRHEWAIIPPHGAADGRKSSSHLFALRVEGITETQRDAIITRISQKGVAVNVHFIPMPMLTLSKNMGFRIEDFPQS